MAGRAKISAPERRPMRQDPRSTPPQRPGAPKPRTWLRALGSLGLASVLACGTDRTPPIESHGDPATVPEPSATAPSDDLFVDAAPSSGLDFTHFNGMTGKYYFAEMMGSGAALFDYDGDGDLDVYLVQGGLLDPEADLADAVFPPPDLAPPRDRLFRNDLPPSGDGTPRSPTFTDVTAAIGIVSEGYGMGTAVGDVDNDGDPDLYVTHFGVNRLWRNDGGADGTVRFTDVTEASGTGDPRWGVSAAFFDYDRDGDLDLYVGNYVDYSIAAHKPCTTELGRPNYCGPLSYAPQADVLYENRGDGTFEDVTSRAGLGGARGGALGVLPFDANGDGWPDLYVANDGVPNQLWIHGGAGGDGRVTFRDEALLGGTAVNDKGQPEASMGVDAADFDGDGDEDLFMTHLTRETNTLFVNDGRGSFVDASVRAGLGAPSLAWTGFGTSFFDYDNDGVLDLLTANGAVKVIEELALAGDPLPLHQPNQLFRGRGDGTFEEVTARAGEVFRHSEVSRGAAFGDVDNDGDTDVLLTNNSGRARLLVNRTGQDHGWIGLRLVGGGGRDLLGAWVGIFDDSGRAVWRRARTAGSYASSNDPRVLVGLGQHGGGPVRVRVRWPDDRGRVWEEWPRVATGTYTELRRGSGEEVTP